VKQLYFDLKDEAQVKAIGSALIRDKYEIDVLINNAAIAAGGYFQMISLGKIRELFDVNFFNQLLLTQSVAKNMMSRMRGSIINMASVAGLDPDLGFIGYGSSKAALIYATQVMAKEYAPYHIRVNAIAPGLTDTDMANQMEAKARERLIEASAVKRLITPEEVAGVAYYLAGDESADVNGQIFRVDGSK
jgi:3-oxoacyl-[acyl-carrier protein] reductase